MAIPARRAMALIAAAAVVACADTSSNAATRGANDEGKVARGRALVIDRGCGACHTVPGVPQARGLVGPPLAGVRERGYLGGVVPNTPEGMVRWLRFPQEADPGTVMPNLGLSEAEARDIAAFLNTV